MTKPDTADLRLRRVNAPKDHPMTTRRSCWGVVR